MSLSPELGEGTGTVLLMKLAGVGLIHWLLGSHGAQAYRTHTRSDLLLRNKAINNG